MMTRILLQLLAFYKRWLSPALHAIHPGGGCKFLPTCSEYASVAIATHGPLRGSALAAWRLLRCHPFTPGGFDPVPPVASRPGSPILHQVHPAQASDPRVAAVAPHEPLP